MNQKMTYGQKMVGIRFNPSQLSDVDHCKQKFADCIDLMNNLRNMTTSSEQQRLCDIAIREIQSAQMWSVKALTWNE